MSIATELFARLRQAGAKIEVEFHGTHRAELRSLDELELLETNRIRFWANLLGNSEPNIKAYDEFMKSGQKCSSLNIAGKPCRSHDFNQAPRPETFRAGIDDRCSFHQ